MFAPPYLWFAVIWDATLGFPGEGMGDGRPRRTTVLPTWMASLHPHLSSPSTPPLHRSDAPLTSRPSALTPTPPSGPLACDNATTLKMVNARSSFGRVPFAHMSAETFVDRISTHAGIGQLVRDFNTMKTRELKERRMNESSSDSEDGKKPGVRGVGVGPSSQTKAAVQKRKSRWSLEIDASLNALPAEEQASVLDTVLQGRPEEVRASLRGKFYIRCEGFLAARSAITKLQSEWWTAENWLELRLKKFLPMSVFTLGHKLFSKTEGENGRWVSATLLPGPIRDEGEWGDAHKWGIRGPLRVPSPFRPPWAMKAAMEKILSKHRFKVSDDGVAAALDPVQMSNECLNAAATSDNLLPLPDIAKPRRSIMFLFDALGFFRGGRMLARFGVRCVDMVRSHNSPYFFRNIALYLGKDAHADLRRY